MCCINSAFLAAGGVTEKSRSDQRGREGRVCLTGGMAGVCGLALLLAVCVDLVIAFASFLPDALRCDGNTEHGHPRHHHRHGSISIHIARKQRKSER